MDEGHNKVQEAQGEEDSRVLKKAHVSEAAAVGTLFILENMKFDQVYNVHISNPYRIPQSRKISISLISPRGSEILKPISLS